MTTSPNSLTKGVIDIIPMLIGTAPFGFIFGVFAVEMGLGFSGGQGFSLFVFAGSAQFAGANLYGHGVSLVIIFTTTLLINLRHALYGAVLAGKLSNTSFWQKIWISFFLTDEAFAVVSRFKLIILSYFWGAALAMYVNWQFWTFLGIIFSNRFKEYVSLNLGFLMVPALIAVIVPQITSKGKLLCCLLTVIFSILFVNMPHQSGMIFSSLIGIIITLVYEHFTLKSGE